MFREGRACTPNSERASFIGLSSNSNWISFETKRACLMSSRLLFTWASALKSWSAEEGASSSAARRASKRVSSGGLAT